VPRASSIQLAQPLLSVIWSWLLIGEPLRPRTILAALLVLVCVGTAQRARIATANRDQPRPPTLQPGRVEK
jgi:drug/metabolite transporter (DMT)-like permease